MKNEPTFSFRELLDKLEIDKAFAEVDDDDDISPEHLPSDTLKTIPAGVCRRISEEELQEITRPYRFPYEEYHIVGNTTEIEKIIYANSIIDIDAADILSTLSKETVNYVLTGSAEGPGSLATAMKVALKKLPVEKGRISKMLFNVWISKDVQTVMRETQSMMNIIDEYQHDIDVFWGIAWDESLKGQQVRVSLIVAGKKIGEQ